MTTPEKCTEAVRKVVDEAPPVSDTQVAQLKAAGLRRPAERAGEAA